jgi:hypothetical protein
VSRTDEVQRVLAALIDARRSEIDTADDLARLEVQLYFRPQAVGPVDAEVSMKRKQRLGVRRAEERSASVGRRDVVR